MSTVRVILAGRVSTTIHDIFDHPLVLQFGDKRNYDEAVWVIPSYARRIPASRLSEIRVEEGTLSVIVDGPDGFRSGPHEANWVRSYYPRGKHCALLHTEPGSMKTTGVTLTTIEGTLIVDELSLGGGSEPEAQKTDDADA